MEMLTDSQTSAHEQIVIRIMRRLPAERILQLMDFARFLELETTNTVLLKFQIANRTGFVQQDSCAGLQAGSGR